MPKIVNKEERKKEIAMSCKELFIEKGINGLTVAEAAKAANIGKGTIYEYFENKDEIVFEIVNIMIEEKNRKKREMLEKVSSTKEKIKLFFTFFYEEESKELCKLYKEFISITLVSPEDTKLCNKDDKDLLYLNWFRSIIQEGIDNKEIHPNSMKLSMGLFSLGQGLFIIGNTSSMELDIQKEINNHIEALFEFIKVKK